jgi:hypothetical protein
MLKVPRLYTAAPVVCKGVTKCLRADILTADDQGRLPIHFAVRKGYYSAVSKYYLLTFLRHNPSSPSSTLSMVMMMKNITRSLIGEMMKNFTRSLIDETNLRNENCDCRAIAARMKIPRKISHQRLI